ncbi:MAG: acetyl-CoA carboxylase biotin carboxyl carrier protein [Gammaproteobacteria bacterium]|nr:acetyl-CoA carboxylase biotin carboxyl carrier protein [Gammaproteobacteria bacterium]
MDLRKIKKLIELVEESGITELQVRSGEEEVRISRATLPVATQSVAAAAPETTASPVETTSAQRGEVVAAPMAGTFYRAPAPGETPFVAPGATVAVGDVLCIIESMKMMNHIEAEEAGEVVDVLAADGQPIETGAPLFRIA